MAATSSLYAGGKSIKSKQRGTTTVYPESSASASINAVDTSKSFISATSGTGSGRNYPQTHVSNFTSYAYLSGSTSVAIGGGRSYFWYGQYVYSEQGTVAWEVIEFE